MALSTLATNAVVGAANQVIDRLFETDTDRAKAKAVLLELQQQGQLAQIEVNKVEAQHRSLLVAGWRPFIGWSCGLAIFLAFVAFPTVQYAVAVTTGEYIEAPAYNFSTLMPLIMGMLGLGGLRTYEKNKGVAR